MILEYHKAVHTAALHPKIPFLSFGHLLSTHFVSFIQVSNLGILVLLDLPLLCELHGCIFFSRSS